MVGRTKPMQQKCLLTSACSSSNLPSSRQCRCRMQAFFWIHDLVETLLVLFYSGLHLQDMVTVHVCSSASLNLHVYQGQSQPRLTDNVQSPISSRKTVTTFNNNSASPCDQHRHAPITDSLHLVHLWKSRSAVV